MDVIFQLKALSIIALSIIQHFNGGQKTLITIKYNTLRVTH